MQLPGWTSNPEVMAKERTKFGVKMASPMNGVARPHHSSNRGGPCPALWDYLEVRLEEARRRGVFQGPESCKAADHTFRMATTHLE